MRMWLFMMAALLFGASMEAEELVTVAALQADPSRFNLKVVTLTGTAQVVRPLQDDDPAVQKAVVPNASFQLDTQCAYLHPAYRFVLADDTGFLPVLVRARPPCVSKLMPREPPEIADDDHVVVTAQITVVEKEVDGVRRPVPEALAVAIRKGPTP